MNYIYSINDFPFGKYNLDRLTKEIADSTIIVALSYMTGTSEAVSIFFKASLSAGEKTTLDEIIANHSGEMISPKAEITKVEIISEHAKYIESGNTTQSFFAAETILIDISVGESIKIVDYKWPFDIALKTGTLYITEDMVGDEMTVEAAPNSVVGAIIQNVNIGDTSIYGSPTVMENAKRGYWCNIYPAGTEISRICTVEADHIGICPPATMNIAAGNYISVTPKIIPYVYFNSAGKLEIGKTLQMGQRVPKGEIIRIKYKNNNGLAKKISWFIEYLY
jgi:hypothetical protein